jgi:hypothetical protein
VESRNARVGRTSGPLQSIYLKEVFDDQQAYRKNKNLHSQRPLSVFPSFRIVTALTEPAMAQNPVPLTNEPLVPDAVAPGGAGFTLVVNYGFAVYLWGASRST